MSANYEQWSLSLAIQIFVLFVLQLFTRFNHLGLCVGIHGTMNVVDRIRKNFDSTVFEWRSSITDHLLLPSDVSTADTIPYAESSSTSMSVETPAQSPVRQAQSPMRQAQSPMRHPSIPLLRRPSLVSDSDEPSSRLSMSSDINSISETQGNFLLYLKIYDYNICETACVQFFSLKL